jgi:hypothetical protein
VNSKTVARTLSLLSIIALPACSAMIAKDSLSAPEQIQMSKMDVNRYPVTKTVCDPMGGDNDPRSNAGLKADLYWLTSSQSAANSTVDLISRGTKSSQNLFFTQLNAPTRLFDKGFNNDLGQPLKDDTGKTLIENFALRFSSVLRLAPSQAEGLYEFAVLSDDGTVMRLRDDNGVYSPVVSSDGNHPTTMGCSTQLIDMKSDTEKLMQLDYYQGPRYHISLVVMMRKVTDAAANGHFAADPLCGMSSNNAWFDPDHGSVPQKSYNDLLARGWQVLTADNYAIPNSVSFNPCKEGDIPTITNAKLGETFTDSVTLSWDTDLMSTSQIVVTNVATGSQTISIADNVMNTQHQVTLTGLSADTVYTVQAVSISDTYGKGLSDPIAYRTAQ